MTRLSPLKRSRRTMGGLIGGLLLCAAVALPTQAMAAAQFSIDEYRITSDLPNFASSPGPPQVDPTAGPSTLQAGASPSSGSFTSYSWAGHLGTTDDVKTAVTNFGAGLLANPESRAKCSQALLAAGGKDCPADSLLGTSRFDVGSNATGTTAASFQGKLYNSVPDAGKPGQLATITILSSAGFATTPPTAGSYAYSPIPFEITPRSDGNYGLTGTLDDITRPLLPSNGVATGLSFLVNADTKFVRNPTSCVENVSTGTGVGYDNPEVVTSPEYKFTPTGCDQVTFGPTFAIDLGNEGTTKLNGYPPVGITISSPSGDADQQANKITLPVELNTNNTAYKLCTQAQADADSCPADSQFGGARATSPFLSQPVSGPVYLIQQTSSSLPGLLIDLRGLVHVKIQTATELVGGKQIRSTSSNLPQLPISQINVGLNGGKKTGVFQNRSDLCFEDNSRSKFKDVTTDTEFTGWNGKVTTAKVNATVQGCPPGVSGKITGVNGSQPKLTVDTDKAPDSQNIKELVVRVKGKTLRFVKGKLRRGVSGQTSASLGRSNISYVNSHRLKVTGLGSSGVKTVDLLLKKGAVKLGSSARKTLRRGHRKTFTLKVAQIPVSGAQTTNTLIIKAKGKKQR